MIKQECVMRTVKLITMGQYFCYNLCIKLKNKKDVNQLGFSLDFFRTYRQRISDDII